MSVPVPVLPPVRPSRPLRGPARAWILALLAASAASLWPAAARAQQRTVLAGRESPLPDAPYDPGTLAIVISPDGSRSVPVVRAGETIRVVDGHPGPGYETVVAGSPLLSADGRHCAYAARRENPWLGEHLWYVVFDGAEQGPFFTVQPHSLALGPDGTWLACVVGRRDGSEAVCVFSQDAPAGPAAPAAATQPADPAQPATAAQPAEPVPAVHTDVGRWFDRVGDHPPRFSPDGKYLAYAARHDGKWHVVLNGVEGEPYDAVGGPRFCPSGAVLGYVARREGKAVVVTLEMGLPGAAGAESRAHEEIAENSLAFSFDGSHLAYVAGKAGAMSVYVNRSEFNWPKTAPGDPLANAAPFDQVAAGSLAFSPDGLHLAFAASRGGRWFVMRDGVEGRGYAGLGAGPPAFSNDGKRLAYVAERIDRAGAGRRERPERFVVVDGVEQKPYDRVRAGPMFSGDGKRCAYVAERGTQSFLVIDGMEGTRYDCIRGRPVLSPDGSRCAFTALATDAAGRFSAVEEVERDPADPSAGSRLIFDRCPEFPRLTEKDQKQPVKLLMVEERVAQE